MQRTAAKSLVWFGHVEIKELLYIIFHPFWPCTSPIKHLIVSAFQVLLRKFVAEGAASVFEQEGGQLQRIRKLPTGYDVRPLFATVVGQTVQVHDLFECHVSPSALQISVPCHPGSLPDGYLWAARRTMATPKL